MPINDEIGDNILRNALGKSLFNVNGQPMQGHAIPSFKQLLEGHKKITLIPSSGPIYHYHQHFVKNKTYIDHKTACRIFPNFPRLPRTRWDALEFE